MGIASVETVLESEIGRFYQLPVQSKSCSTYGYDLYIGALSSSQKSLDEIRVSLQKAESGPYSAFHLPANLFYHPKRAEILALLEKSELPVILAVQREHLQDKSLLLWLLRQPKSKYICNYIFDDYVASDSERILELEKIAKFVYYTFVPHRGVDMLTAMGQLPERIRCRLFFYFPYANVRRDKFFSCRQIHFLYRRLQKAYPEILFRPAPGLDVFDTRIPEDRNLEPMIPVRWQTNYSFARLKISVVIPSYNNRMYLANTVKHLLRQDFDRDAFEIVIVDDGSTDDSFTLVRQIVEGEIDRVNCKYIYFPRMRQRKMGDNQFRAGVARNLGVKHSAGEVLAFLDSDIITPKNFLSDVWEKHKYYDVLQAKRIQLKRGVSTEFTRIEDVKKGRDTYITDDGYWEEFQSTKDWMALEDRWRFTCTHSLSIKRGTWERIGGFRKNYIFYGYEDTEIGYDLARLGCRFLLNDIEVFHLDHRVQRSEFFKSHKRKKLLLASSAMTFFHNTLHPGVYAHLEWLFLPYLKFRVYFGDGLRPFWRVLRPALKIYYAIDYKIMNGHWRLPSFGPK